MNIFSISTFSCFHKYSEWFLLSSSDRIMWLDLSLPSGGGVQNECVFYNLSQYFSECVLEVAHFLKF